MSKSTRARRVDIEAEAEAIAISIVADVMEDMLRKPASASIYRDEYAERIAAALRAASRNANTLRERRPHRDDRPAAGVALI